MENYFGSGAGYIGRNKANELVNQGCRAVILNNLSAGNSGTNRSLIKNHAGDPGCKPVGIYKKDSKID